MKSIKLTECLKLIKPKYVYLRIIPHSSIRNYNSSNIAKAFSYTYKSINRRMNITWKKYRWAILPTEVEVQQLHKLSYLVDIKKNQVSFYFIVSEYFEDIAREKIAEVWNRATIEKVHEIPGFSNEALKYEMVYKNEDALSLRTDRRNNEPLNSVLSVINIMKENDRIGIFYNFMPLNQLGWKKSYNQTIDRIKMKLPVTRNKLTGSYMLLMGLNYIMDFIDSILEALTELMGSRYKRRSDEESLFNIVSSMIQDKVQLSQETRKKKEQRILTGQILVLSESEDEIKRRTNGEAVCSSFKALDGDNELLYREIKNRRNIDFHDYRISGVQESKLSTDECGNFIQIPGRELLEEYNFIEKKDTFESPIPEELQSGVMCIGEATYRGNKQKVYLSTDKNYKFLTLCIVGPTRSGKTTLISNLSKSAVEYGETTILFDFCGNCELSSDVSRGIKEDKILNIDCSKFETLQGLGYNEIVPKEDNMFEVYRTAKTKTSQLMTLINSINETDGDLRARMERYLESAAVITFLNNGPVRDVFVVLQDYEIRKAYIDNIPEKQRENTQEYIRALRELDEWSKGNKDKELKVTGTRIGNVQGILNRVNKLKQNTYMELMLKKDTKDNINLIEEMQKSQLICIKTPEVMFSTETEKDIYCTYWLTKIWGALQVRKWSIQEEKRIKVNIVFDELYQVPRCQEFLRSKLSQIAKFGCKPIISCHYLGQISIIRNELKAANSSYMLISGCDKDNFKELKSEFYPYELEDLMNLKRYESLNLIKYEGGWGQFIGKMEKMSIKNSNL